VWMGVDSVLRFFRPVIPPPKRCRSR
jgi:hypothetical protein